MAAAFSADPVAAVLYAAGQIQPACLALAARRQGVECRVDGEAADTLRLDWAGGVAYCHKTQIKTGPPGARQEACTLLNGAIHTLAQDKQATKVVLNTMGFSTPDGALFAAGEEDAAVAWMRARGCPVCIKPQDGTYGIGIITDLDSEDSLRRAFVTATQNQSRILVEEQVSARPPSPTPERATFRFFFVAPAVVAARMDLPANVTGDGQSSVRTLLDRKNAEKATRCNQPPVILDAQVRGLLARQGLMPDDCPADGRRVLLSTLSNAAQGGDSHLAPPGLHPSYAIEMDRMFRLLRGMKVGAADVVLLDHTAPCRPETYRVLEVNAAPGMVHFHFPWTGEPQDVAGAIIALLLHGDRWPHRMPRP